MASKTKSSKRSSTGSSVTAPKGRPTAGRGETRTRGKRITPTMEWIIALVVLAAVIVGLVVVFGDVRTTGGGHSGLGVDDRSSVDGAIVELHAAAG